MLVIKMGGVNYKIRRDDYILPCKVGTYILPTENSGMKNWKIVRTNSDIDSMTLNEMYEEQKKLNKAFEEELQNEYNESRFIKINGSREIPVINWIYSRIGYLLYNLKIKANEDGTGL